ncbi:MAG TPA: hypothetical protein VLC95_02615, partial [Anaerolineae bacterium]|nr:hypothetical protein [Anaerolineae bacterium]
RDDGWLAIEAMARGDAPVDELRQARGEGAAEIVAGLLGDEHYEIAVNVPNDGHISNLPNGAIVEIPAWVGGWGIRGLHVGRLPEAVAELCRREITVASLAVDASATGDRRMALQALLLDPTINDIDTAHAILDAYLQEYEEYLPSFGRRKQ